MLSVRSPLHFFLKQQARKGCMENGYRDQKFLPQQRDEILTKLEPGACSMQPKKARKSRENAKHSVVYSFSLNRRDNHGCNLNSDWLSR